MPNDSETLGGFIEVYNNRAPLPWLWDIGRKIHILLSNGDSSKRLSELKKSPCATCELRAQWPEDNQTIIAYSGEDSSYAQLFCTYGKPISRLHQPESLRDLPPFLDTPAKPLILKEWNSIDCPLWK